MNYKKIKKELYLTNKKQQNFIMLIIVCFFQFLLFFTPILAEEALANTNVNLATISINREINSEILVFMAFNGFFGEHYVSSKLEEEMIEEKIEIEEEVIIKETITYTGVHTITAYNSLPEQTNDQPCITANGFNVCKHGIEDTIAANFLEFGSIVRLPDLFGDRIFIVRDRMNRRYPYRLDIWMLERQDAINFGIKQTRIEVVKFN